MSDYGDFARFYDRFTQNVNYPARARYFDAVIQKYNPDAKLLLDLACGTGSLSFELEEYGYDIVAVDNSYEMLSVAAEKRGKLESDVLFLCQEMSELDLFGTIDATVCSLDSINHILDEQELLDVFKKVALFSNRGAVFVFDVNTVYKHRQVLGDNCFVYENGDTEEALRLSNELNEYWHQYEKKVTMLVHDDALSGINVSIAKITPFISNENDALIAEIQSIYHQIDQIYEEEFPNWYNIL